MKDIFCLFDWINYRAGSGKAISIVVAVVREHRGKFRSAANLRKLIIVNLMFLDGPQKFR